MTIGVAAFDFDGTLTTRDTVVPFLRRLAGTRSVAVRMLTRPHRLARAAVRRDRDAIRAAATLAAFRGRPADEVAVAARDHGEHILATALRDDLVGRLRWHVERGDRVVIVSASYEDYVRVVGERLGATATLATRLELVGGRCTGRLLGGNCRGPEKVRRLHAWFEAEGWSPADVELWAYGDSRGDRELLAAARHAHWVGDPLTDPVI